jgi:predicted regulator of Ras-like GTPase activity (Roadblock/LC7/MglB family)
MSNEVYAFALESTLDEIQNACPDVTSNFVFKDGKIIAKNKNTTEENATQTINAFDAITERANAIGDVDNITIRSAKGKVTISAINDFYVTTVSSKEADEKYVNTLTRILIPIVIKLSKKIQPASPENETIILDQPKPEDNTNEAAEEAVEETSEIDEAEDQSYQTYYEEEKEEPAPVESETYEETEQAEPEAKYDDEPLLPEPPVTQLIVENLGGLLVPSDTVRIDKEVITQWNELYGDLKIKEVEVEALNGKTTRCKFKQIKKSKDAGKGIVKMPEKIQLTLETQQGELVTIKPVIEETR